VRAGVGIQEEVGVCFVLRYRVAGKVSRYSLFGSVQYQEIIKEPDLLFAK
jgi:hypothetical protein